MGTWPQYRLHNHKLYRPEGKIHLKYLETTIGYTLFYYSFVSKIKIIHLKNLETTIGYTLFYDLFVSKIKNNPKYLL